MGCVDSSDKENVIIEVAYCGSCGWAIPAKKLCDRIKAELPKAVIDCRPENEYTGLIKATLIVDRKDRKQVYRGNKDSTVANTDKVVLEIVNAYRQV